MKNHTNIIGTSIARQIGIALFFIFSVAAFAGVKKVKDAAQVEDPVPLIRVLGLVDSLEYKTKGMVFMVMNDVTGQQETLFSQVDDEGNVSIKKFNSLQISISEARDNLKKTEDFINSVFSKYAPKLKDSIHMYIRKTVFDLFFVSHRHPDHWGGGFCLCYIINI